MASYEFIGLVFTGLSISISIIYYASVIRNANKAQQTQQDTRNAQFFMDFARELHKPEKLAYWVQLLRYEWDDFADFERKYGSVDNPEEFGRRYSHWALFNDLGWLVEKGVVSVADVNALVGQPIYWTWEKFEDVILERRRVYNVPDELRYWEQLNKRIIDYRKQEKIFADNPEYYDDYLSSLSN